MDTVARADTAIAYDQRGHGEREKHDLEDYAPRRLVEDAIAVLMTPPSDVR